MTKNFAVSRKEAQPWRTLNVQRLLRKYETSVAMANAIVMLACRPTPFDRKTLKRTKYTTVLMPPITPSLTN